MKKTNNDLKNHLIDCIRFQFAKDRKLKYKIALVVFIFIGAKVINFKSRNAYTIKLYKKEKLK